MLQSRAAVFLLVIMNETSALTFASVSYFTSLDFFNGVVVSSLLSLLLSLLTSLFLFCCLGVWIVLCVVVW